MKEKDAWQHAYTNAKNFPRSQECQPSISETFVRLNVLYYKRDKKSDHKREVIETALR